MAKFKTNIVDIVVDGIFKKAKECSVCHIVKTLDEYRDYKRGLGGRYSKCKECEKDSSLTYYNNNKEKCRLNHKEWKKLNQEKIKSYREEYYWANPDKYKAEAKVYRQENPKVYSCEEIKKRYKKIADWKKKNKEKIYIYKQRRRTKIKTSDNNFSDADWRLCLEHFGHSCAYCGAKEKLTIEHFIPVAKYGGLSSGNVLPACGSCNSSKCDSDFSKWYPKQDYYSKQREEKILTYLGYDEKNNN